MNLINILNEHLNDQEAVLLYNEGKKLFPKLILKFDTPKYHGLPRFFYNYPTNKGSFGASTFKHQLIQKKIELIMKWLTDKGYTKDINHSIRTNSKYFTINNHNVRLSDHKKHFDGVDAIIKWDTSAKEIIDYILSNTK